MILLITVKLFFFFSLEGVYAKKNTFIVYPPYSDSIKANLRKEFFRLLSKHFPSHYKLFKICRKNYVKLSYSSIPNVAAITSSHNKTLLRKTSAESDPLLCICQDKLNCPLGDGNRKMKIFPVYRATVYVNIGVARIFDCGGGGGGQTTSYLQ